AMMLRTSRVGNGGFAVAHAYLAERRGHATRNDIIVFSSAWARRPGGASRRPVGAFAHPTLPQTRCALAARPVLPCPTLRARPPRWGGGGGGGVARAREPFCMPPPCPSPVNGGGDAGAAFPLTVASGPSAASFAAMARAAMLACNDHTAFPLSRMARIAIIA